MANTIFFCEMANLYAGDADPTDSKYLAIEEVKLPDLQGIFADHNPGGSPVAINVQVGVEKLEPTFKLKGFDPALLAQFGYGSSRRERFTIYAVMRDLRTGEAQEGKALIEGRLGRIAPDAWKRGEMASQDYAIHEVVHYEVFFGGQEILYWDFFTTEWRTNGQVQNSRERAILRLP